MIKYNLICCLFFVSYAAQSSNINPSRQIENQEKFLERQRQQQEIEKKINEPISNLNSDDVTSLPEPDSKPGSVTFSDINIDFSGKKIYIDFSDILNRYVNRPTNNVKLFELIRQLTARLYEKGYSTSAIILKKPAVVNGVLQLKIEWGLLDSVTINNIPAAGFREKSMLYTALPINRYGIVNMHDFDQTIENMNNGFKTAKIKVLPADEFGHSLVDFNVEYDRSPKLSFRMDNTSQSDDYTPYRYTSNVLLGDIFLVNDTFNFGGNFKNYSDHDRNEYGLNTSYTIPIGYSKLIFSGTYSKSESPFYISGKNFSYVSKSDSYSIKLARTLFRNTQGKFGAFFEFKTKDNTTFFDQEFLSQNSLNYTDATVGLDLLYKPAVGSIYADISFTHGIRGNNGDLASYNTEGAYDWAKFISGTITYDRPINLYDESLSFRTQTGFQYTTQSLVSNYQQTLGDEYTIRGLNSNSAINGDSGAYINNSLGYDFNIKIFNKDISISPFIGLDLGYSRDNFLKNNIFISSASTGFKFNFYKVDYSLSYGQVFMSNKESIPNGIAYLSGGVSF